MLKETVTNWFAVKDDEAYKKMVQLCDPHNLVVRTTEISGEKLHVIQCCGYAHLMQGSVNEYGRRLHLLDSMQPLIADGHALIATEIGHNTEGMPEGLVYIVTNKGVTSVNLLKAGTDLSRFVLSDPQYDPKLVRTAQQLKGEA